MTSNLKREAGKVGLRISWSKTKVMNYEQQSMNNPVMMRQQRLEEVTRLTYLGSILASDGDANYDLACQIAKAGAVFQRLQPISSAQSTPIKR